MTRYGLVRDPALGLGLRVWQLLLLLTAHSFGSASDASNSTYYAIPAGGKVANCGYYTIDVQMWAGNDTAYLYVSDTVSHIFERNQWALSKLSRLVRTPTKGMRRVDRDAMQAIHEPSPQGNHMHEHAYLSAENQPDVSNQPVPHPRQYGHPITLGSGSLVDRCAGLAKLVCKGRHLQKD